MNIVLLGAPGSGKGTLASRLEERLHIPHIATADIFRFNLKNNTEIKINTSRMNILNTADKQKAWNDLLSERKTQTEMEKIDYKNSSLDDKIKIAKNQIQKENKPMSQVCFLLNSKVH